jgi:Uma2 family endonuclease
MVRFDPLLNLPSSDELPCSDDTPVDNELQNLVPNFLEVILGFIWLNRNDWFFAVDMGIYHTTGSNPRIPIVPDGFLCLGVERLKNDQLRDSYIVWEENNVVPIWVLEVVSKTYGGEYDQKLKDYAQMGVLYYTVYNPIYSRRDKHEPLEVYRLVKGVYELQSSLGKGELGGVVWMPEVGLGIGRGMGSYCGLQREWLYWYDQAGNRFLTPEEVAQQERSRSQKLAAKLRELGIDPDAL